MRKKRAKELVAVGWLVIAFASYLFYQSMTAFTELLKLPWSAAEIMERGGTLKTVFLSVALTRVFSLLLLVAAIGVLYVRRWAVVLLLTVFAFDCAKRIYLMSAFTHAMNSIFVLEIVLFFLSLYYLLRRQVREGLR